jgi:hypothetical protein
MIDKTKIIKKFKANRKSFFKESRNAKSVTDFGWIEAFLKYCKKQDRFLPQERKYIDEYMDTKEGAEDIISFDEKISIEIKKSKKVKQ